LTQYYMGEFGFWVAMVLERLWGCRLVGRPFLLGYLYSSIDSFDFFVCGGFLCVSVTVELCEGERAALRKNCESGGRQRTCMWPLG
jgi:hypothetical protein